MGRDYCVVTMPGGRVLRRSGYGGFDPMPGSAADGTWMTRRLADQQALKHAGAIVVERLIPGIAAKTGAAP